MPVRTSSLLLGNVELQDERIADSGDLADIEMGLTVVPTNIWSSIRGAGEDIEQNMPSAMRQLPGDQCNADHHKEHGLSIPVVQASSTTATDTLSPLSLDINSFSIENSEIILGPTIPVGSFGPLSLNVELHQFVAESTYENECHAIALPLAPRLRPVDLPAEYPGIIISLNPLIMSTRTRGKTTRIHWNLSQPLTRAVIPSMMKRTWWNQPATRPNIGSMTLRIDGLSRPVVVFPRTPENTFIAIGDLLRAVERANADEGVYGNYAMGMRWGGLRRSSDELDVWVVDIHRR